MNIIDSVEKESFKDIPLFKAGDTVSVSYKIKEGEKERIQVFEGIVISRKGTSIRETFTVRKISYGVGTERIFPLHSKQIDKIDARIWAIIFGAVLQLIGIVSIFIGMSN